MSEYICVDHNSAACLPCADHMRSVESENRRLREALEKVKDISFSYNEDGMITPKDFATDIFNIADIALHPKGEK